jgi:hypothetical protein
MAGYAEEVVQIPDEKLRSDLLNLIGSFVRALQEYRDWDQLLEFVQSSIDTLRIGIASGLYGHRDPRTQKLFKLAEQRAFDRAMMPER